MQTIKTEHGVYKIADNRDAGEFMRKLAKPAKRKRIEKMDVRRYPSFIPGHTSVRAYVAQYHEMNGLPGLSQDFPNLSTAPAACYDLTIPLCEVIQDAE